MKHRYLHSLNDTPIPEGYGVLHGPDFTTAAKGTPSGQPLQQVEDFCEWIGPERANPLEAVIDAWVHITGSTPV